LSKSEGSEIAGTLAGRVRAAKLGVGAIEIEIARGSALECAAIEDVLVIGKAVDKTESQSRNMELDRTACTTCF
jgi:hypothetical protein